ncbi:response regulator transcription factor [Catenuloplanes atrovinosus]|uniref:DNA-binding response OmpR family regulator n=1 Tax=Catenuloplanes atrovinosus TaxID=137266 RepID=A0AAE3YMP6_9ACTN|nr:response regulator transcription factor [Catenuloplanes atrovinosus]MDR7275320.1 DNA-binding response OmpR family regulator [Catenuloplanes atrovinosus]
MATILVVDDDPAIRQLLTDVLEMDGHVVAVAVDGNDGLRAYDVLQPDFVILDVMMPGLDGYGVLRSIRGHEGDPVPVLMLTAAADSDSAARGWADGVDYYLAKPFTADTLLDLVEGVLGDRVPGVGDDG